ncbi:hypothetical protein ACFLY1_00140 [Patescibacteria group bacterium]
MHEAGHWVFAIFGDTIGTFGGTLMQLLMPVIFVIAFLRQSDYFGAAFGLGWLADNLFGVAIYIADARKMLLPLLGGDNVGHDWNNLLSKFGLLEYDAEIALAVKFSAVIIMSVALVFGLMILWEMYKSREKLN